MITELPDRVELIDEDLEGEYSSNSDCPLARALKREGVPIGAGPGPDSDYYLVIDEGNIIKGRSSLSPVEGQYRYDDGAPFCCDTLRTGILVLDSIGEP